MSNRPSTSTCPSKLSGTSAVSSIEPSSVTTPTTAASANFPLSVRISRWRAIRSRSTGSSVGIGSATSNPACSTACSSASAVVTPGT